MQNDDVCNLWQAQGSGPAPLTLEELRRKSDRFHSMIARRNLREYLVTALLVLFFGYFAWSSKAPLMRAGYGLTVAGLFYMAYQLHRQASAADVPAEMALKTCAAFHRAELERQREALRSVWKWYLGPMVPGLAMVMAPGVIAGFHRSPWIGIVTLVPVGVVALVFWWVGKLNAKAAAWIQQQLEALD